MFTSPATFIEPTRINPDPRYAKYPHVYNQLKQEIVFGPYKPGDKFLSFRELQALYGVDTQTIRRALDLLGADGLIVRRQGSGSYIQGPDHYRAGLSMGTVWFCHLKADKTNPYYQGLMLALQRQASQRKLNVVFHWNADWESFSTWFQPEPGDGLILTGDVDPDFIPRLESLDPSRVVVLGNYQLPPHVPNVHTRIGPAIHQAVGLAAEQGHRRLGVVAGPEHLQITRDIWEAVRKAAEDFDMQLVDGVFGLPEDGYAGMQHLQQAGIDSVLVTEPAFFGLCRHVFEQHLKTPDELFVIRYGRNDEFDFYRGVAALILNADKDDIAANGLDLLFGQPEERRVVDIAIRDLRRQTHTIPPTQIP